jgi:hypothetical protein
MKRAMLVCLLVVTAAIGAALVAPRGAADDAPKARRPQWEYRVLTGPELERVLDKKERDKADFDALGRGDDALARRAAVLGVMLGKLGGDGWELCAVTRDKQGEDELFYFRRQR